jgi:hypothetical protein
MAVTQILKRVTCFIIPTADKRVRNEEDNTHGNSARLMEQDTQAMQAARK